MQVYAFFSLLSVVKMVLQKTKRILSTYLKPPVFILLYSVVVAVVPNLH